MMVDKLRAIMEGVPTGTLYIDMDGVLARFEEEHNALERFVSEHDFFEKLAPTSMTKQLMKELEQPSNLKVMEELDIFILTSSPHKEADTSKKNWIKRYLPILKDRVITVRSGEEKARFASNGLLLDDYTDNLKHWTDKGGKAIKALNKHNGKTLRYKKISMLELRVD